MYITDETFRTMFIEVLKTQSKDDLILNICSLVLFLYNQ